MAEIKVNIETAMWGHLIEKSMNIPHSLELEEYKERLKKMKQNDDFQSVKEDVKALKKMFRNVYDQLFLADADVYDLFTLEAMERAFFRTLDGIIRREEQK